MTAWLSILRAYRDGIPLDLASRMLPAATHADVGLLTHIHMHGQGQVQILNAISRTPNQGASRAGVVGLVDNFLRPRLVGQGAQMHELLVLLSTLGGLLAFGLTGFIIGPVIASLFITLWVIQGAPVRPTDDADMD